MAKRLTFDVGDKFDEVLTEAARSRETTKADIIRKAVATYIYLTKEAKDGSIAIEGASGAQRLILD